MHTTSIALILLSGCGFLGGKAPVDTAVVPVDADGDGFFSVESGGQDCDDADDQVHPDAEEICDERDNDCDGEVDLDDPDLTEVGTWFVDNDGDGFGTPDFVSDGCTQPEGTSTISGDCDDHDDDIHPDAREVCDGVDNDCDDLVDDADDDVVGAGTWYPDEDGDGYGDAEAGSKHCEDPGWGTTIGGDCNDEADMVHPDAEETCGDKVDSDCDGDDC